MQTENLLSLKDDMVAFIAGHGLRRMNGYVAESVPTVLFEDHGNADAWKDFVELAKDCGAAFLTMSEVVLEKPDIEFLAEQLLQQSYPEVDAPELEEARDLIRFVGLTGYLQLGFSHQGVMYVYETATEWYDRFQRLMESIEDFGGIIMDDRSGE